MIGSIRFGQKAVLMLAFLLAGAVVHAEDEAISSNPQSTEVDNKIYWICKNKKEVRTIRVHINPKSGICSTVYSKQGEEKVVGSGKNHESCERFLENIKVNLEKSSWTCRDISAAKITAGLD